MEQNSKSGLSGCEAGLPGWPMLLMGDQVRNYGCPIHELWARTNKDKGKDGQGWVTGKDGQGWIMGKDGQGRIMGKDKDGLGQMELDTNSSG